FSDQKEIINDLRNVVDNFSEHPAFRYFEDFEKYIAGYRQKVTQDYDAIVSKNIDAGSVIIGVIDMYSNLLIEMQFIEEKYPDFINRKELGKIKKSMHRCIDKTKFDYLDTWNNLQSLWTIVDAPIQKTTAIKNDLEFLQPIYESEEAMVVYIGKKDGHFDFLTSTVTRLYNNVKEGYNAKLG
ncbi:MAG: hypothetical protein KKG59_05370, partial [Nanoarchaeota archaeon]|nr:hypothetical protein [Nanoarchaeota archaeon]